MNDQAIQEALADRGANARELRVSDEQTRSVVFEAHRERGEVGRVMRSRRVRITLATAGSAAALTAVAIVASSGSVTPSAYAVQSRPDGRVMVSIHQLSDPAGLERSLREAGIPAVVNYSPAHELTCALASHQASLLSSERRTELRDSIVDLVGRLASGPHRHQGNASAERRIGAKRRELHAATASLKVLLLKADHRGAEATTYSVDPDRIKRGQSLFVSTSAGTVDTIGAAISDRDNPVALCATAGGH